MRHEDGWADWMLPVSGLVAASWAALGMFLALAVWTDLRWRRVPNVLVAWGLALALALPLAAVSRPDESLAWPSVGLSVVGTWAAGLTLSGLLLWPLYLRGAMGAGDIKLMAMAGAFLGPDLAWRAVLYTCVAGGLLALVAIGWQHLRRQGRPTHQAYAPAVAIGSLVAVALHGLPLA